MIPEVSRTSGSRDTQEIQEPTYQQTWSKENTSVPTSFSASPHGQLVHQEQYRISINRACSCFEYGFYILRQIL